MNNKSNWKKGELTTTQIVTMIILITSFVVILYFLYQLGFKETSDRDICKNSVDLKTKDLLGVSSLNCRTQYLCLSFGGACSGANLKIEKVNPEEAIKKIAEEVNLCWWQFGEGKKEFINWVPGLPDAINPLNPKQCGVCDQVYLQSMTIDKNNFYTYLAADKKLSPLRNSLVVPNDFNFDRDFAILYEVEKQNGPYLKLNYVDQIKNEGCNQFFTLA